MLELKEILNEFHEIASNPKAQLKKYLVEGKKVIACAPVYTPEEIVHSMGLVPFGTWGADMELKDSKSYFPAFICSITQSILELGINKEYDGISGIIIPNLCDSLKSLGQNWKYGVPSIPFIPINYPQNRKIEAGIKFTMASYKEVIKELEEATGQKFDDKSLSHSCEIYNKHNILMRKTSEILVDYPYITAAQRAEIFKSAYFMLKEEHISLLEKLISKLEEMPKEENNKIKIITSGILADNPNLLSIIDENNIQIVGDDIAHESRQYRVDVELSDTTTALEALANKFAQMDYCSVLYDPNKKRADLIVDMAKDKEAEAVLMVMTKFCDPEEFDYVIIKKACDTASIPCIQIEVDRQMLNYEQAKTMIQTFVENI
ncbi:MAG: 2-hydroxyacyl-CoA dehydratase [Tissierellia bacterium]|nr:2-hydroxyacyl-CoA dehydratase [Tissierellia bacterium]